MPLMDKIPKSFLLGAALASTVCVICLVAYIGVSDQRRGRDARHHVKGNLSN